MSTKIGTPNYLSPEAFCGMKYTFASDIWSLGCCLYELITFEKPFDYMAIFKKEYDFLHKDKIDV